MKLRLYFFAATLILCTSCATHKQQEQTDLNAASHSRDKYNNFADLAAHERLGIDYQITLVDNKSNYTVFAIHGGNIDKGTSVLAKAMAGDDYNMYLFEGIKPSGNVDLHVTSSHFDEPQALSLAARSNKCLSIHGHKGTQERVCVGGNNLDLKSKISNALKAKNFPFQVETSCQNLDGINKMNIVNRCQNKGVQLEFSSTLRKNLLSNQKLLLELSKTIRESLNTH